MATRKTPTTRKSPTTRRPGPVAGGDATPSVSLRALALDVVLRDYGFGATSVTAFYRKNFLGDDAYGLGAAYDLGGATLKGGIVDGDALTDMSYDFGISMSF